MVRLNRIYTRTGDDGTTGLGDGTRLAKSSTRIAAYGTVDELSSVLGLLHTHLEERERAGEKAADPTLAATIRRVQNELFDVGADLCVPGTGEGLRITKEYTDTLEAEIDRANASLEPLTSFVLPGGTGAAAWLHLARTVCRRAERLVCQLLQEEPADAVNREVVRYLNRLSDLLFVLSRQANDGGKGDVLWKPGASRSS